MRTIFIALWRGFSFRSVLQTDILKTLRADDNVRIVLLLPDMGRDDFWQQYRSDRVFVERLDLDRLTELYSSSPYSYFRILRYLIYGMNRGEVNVANELHKELFAYRSLPGFRPGQLASYVSHKLKYKSLAWLSSPFCYSPRLRKALLAVENRLFSYDIHPELYRKYRPDLLVVSSVGYSEDAFIIREALRYDVKVAALVQSWDNPSTKGYRAAHIDHAIVWNDINRRETEKFIDIPAEKISVGGAPHWDVYFNQTLKVDRSAFLARHGLAADRKTIFFAATADSFYPHNFEIIENVAEAIRTGRYGFDCQLLVRLHPNSLVAGTRKAAETEKKIEHVGQTYGERVVFNRPKATGHNKVYSFDDEDRRITMEILQFSDVMINVYSTMMLEAAVFDLPTVNVGYHSYRNSRHPMSVYDGWEHIKPVNETGAVRNAYNAEELHRYISRYLTDPSLDSGNRKTLVGRFVPNQGQAGRVIGERLLALAGCGPATQRSDREEPALSN